jgi:hypothetical protein
VLIGGRRETAQTLVAHRRECKAPDRLDDAVELKRPKDPWLHMWDEDLA